MSPDRGLSLYCPPEPRRAWRVFSNPEGVRRKRNLSLVAVTDLERGTHGFWAGSAHKLDAGKLTDIGSRAGRARVYWAVDEASVLVPVGARGGGLPFAGGRSTKLSAVEKKDQHCGEHGNQQANRHDYPQRRIVVAQVRVLLPGHRPTLISHRQRPALNGERRPGWPNENALAAG